MWMWIRGEDLAAIALVADSVAAAALDVALGELVAVGAVELAPLGHWIG